MLLQSQRPGRFTIPYEGRLYRTDELGQVEVPDELASSEPSGDDPGGGLLAQPANWRPAAGAKPKARKKAAPAKKATAKKAAPPAAPDAHVADDNEAATPADNQEVSQ